MKKQKSLLLGSAGALVAVSGAMAADLPVKAAAAQYMRVCDLFGNGFYLIPGSDTCIKVGGYVAWKFGYNNTTTTTPHFSGTAGAQDRTVSPFSTRVRGNIQMDTRTLTQYGTLRTLTSIHFQNQGQTESFNTARAMVQWAGFTFGRTQSYADVGKIGGGWSDVTFVTGRETGPNGINTIAYSFDLGSGFVLSIGADERSTKSLTNLSVASALKVGVEPTDFHAGEKWPDVHVDLRQSGPWGYWQVTGMVHDLAGVYYNSGCAQPGTTLCGHPGDRLGFALQFGTELPLPQFGPRDRVGLFAHYGQGMGTNNSGNNVASPALFGSGNVVGTGFRTEGYFVDGSGIELVTGWTVEGGYEHGWSPIFQSNIMFGIGQQLHNAATKNWFLGAVCGVAGTGATQQTAISANRATNSCNPDFTIWQVGSRTRWTPVPGFNLSITGQWTQIITAFSGTATLTGLQGARPTGVYTLNNDKGNFAVSVQAARQFNVGGIVE